MSQQEEPQEPQGELSQFVAAVMARDVEEAEQYRDLLDDHDIPAILGTDEELDEMEDEDRRLARHRGMTHGIPVLVPESLLDEASEIISDREAFEPFSEDEDELEDEEDDEEFDLHDEGDDFDLDEDEEFDEEDDFYEDEEGEDEEEDEEEDEGEKDEDEDF